jgi:ppGpp synthetase/RelA/SpoT-type nucleotidyltranferase
MIVPIAIIRRFEDTNPYLIEMGRRVEDIVFGYCKTYGYAYVGRTKDVESLAEKLESGRYAKWSDLDDLFACTIVIPTLSREASVLEFLNAEFEKVEIRKRGTSQKDPAIFRFDATRFVGRLRSRHVENLSQVRTLTFEVQIRSAFEHAWSVTTHALVYKGGVVDWKRVRLSSQLKAAVEQLDHLILGFDEAAKVIDSHFWIDIEIMKRIESFFKAYFENKTIPKEITPKSWQRFSENIYRLVKQTKGFDRKKPMNSIEKVLEILASTISTNGGPKFPRSISLTQFVVGSVTSEPGLNGSSDYTLIVTPQLLDLFPETKVLNNTFDFQS